MRAEWGKMPCGLLLNKNRNLISKVIFRTSRPIGLWAPLLFPSRLPVHIPWTFLMLCALYLNTDLSAVVKCCQKQIDGKNTNPKSWKNEMDDVLRSFKWKPECVL